MITLHRREIAVHAAVAAEARAFDVLARASWSRPEHDAAIACAERARDASYHALASFFVAAVDLRDKGARDLVRLAAEPDDAGLFGYLGDVGDRCIRAERRVYIAHGVVKDTAWWSPVRRRRARAALDEARLDHYGLLLSYFTASWPRRVRSAPEW